MQYIGLNYKVIVNEVGWVSIVGVNPSHFGCRQENIFRGLSFEEIVYVFLNFEIQFFVSPQNEVAVPLRLEPPQDSRTNQPSMASYVDFGGRIHIEPKVEAAINYFPKTSLGIHFMKYLSFGWN
jgi:hypothetical protein